MLDNLKVSNFLKLDKNKSRPREKDLNRNSTLSIGEPFAPNVRLSQNYTSLKSLDNLNDNEKQNLTIDFVKNPTNIGNKDKDLLHRLKQGVYSTSAPVLPDDPSESLDGSMSSIKTQVDTHSSTRGKNYHSKQTNDASRTDFMIQFDTGSPLSKGLDRILYDKLASKGLSVDIVSSSEPELDVKTQSIYLSPLTGGSSTTNNGLSIKDRIKLLNSNEVSRHGSSNTINYGSTGKLDRGSSNSSIPRSHTVKHSVESIHDALKIDTNSKTTAHTSLRFDVVSPSSPLASRVNSVKKRSVGNGITSSHTDITEKNSHLSNILYQKGLPAASSPLAHSQTSLAKSRSKTNIQKEYSMEDLDKALYAKDEFIPVSGQIKSVAKGVVIVDAGYISSSASKRNSHCNQPESALGPRKQELLKIHCQNPSEMSIQPDESGFDGEDVIVETPISTRVVSRVLNDYECNFTDSEDNSPTRFSDFNSPS